LITNELEGWMRSIGMDVHRDFCEIAIAENGAVRAAGRIKTEPATLALFAQSLVDSDEVVIEATANALAIARIWHGGVRRRQGCVMGAGAFHSPKRSRQ
jgi:predicted NBD/HSP70 family sugar kinase